MLDDHPSLGAGGTTEHVFYNDVDDEGNKILVWDQILKDPSIDVVVNSSMSFSHEKVRGGGGGNVASASASASGLTILTRNYF